MSADFAVAPEVAQAIEAGAPVVALETAVLTHGLPAPHNIEAAHAMEAAVRSSGAVPATTAVIDGRLCVGLDEGQLARLACGNAAKASRRDLGRLAVAGGDGGTTVAAAVFCAAQAGIKVFATGGIGGVHRGAATTFDVSADLAEIARTPVAVVCSGAKSILDVPRTLEVLETHGVPVAGYGIDHFAGFYARETALPVDVRLDSPGQAARLVAAHLRLGGGGLVIANPLPADVEIPLGELNGWIAARTPRNDCVRPVRALAILATLAAVLGGCYLPSDFKAELTITRDGEYHMRYVGDFADSTILTKLAKDDLTPEEEEKRVATLFRDLARDPGFTQIAYRGDAYFEVTYDVRGNIFFDKTLTFVRQSDRIVTLAYVERTEEITMRGGTVPPNFRDMLLDLGYDMRGEFRVITDANVIEHNANQVTGDDQKTYLLIIEDMDSPSPKLVIGEGEPGA